MSKFGDLQRTRGGNGGGGSTESVVFQVKSYHVVDPKNPTKPHPDDYIEAYLFRDALGLTAEFDNDGNPTTVVKIGYGKSNEFNAKRPSILEFQKGKNAAKPMPEHSLGKINRAYYDEKAGMIRGNWLDRWYPTLNQETDYPLAGFMATVRPQGKFKSNGETKYFQNRIVVLPDYAATFAGLDGFKKAAAEAIESLHAAQYPGDHGVIVRAISKSSPEDAADIEVYAGWDRENESPKTGDVAVAEFLASDFGQKWTPYFAEDDDVFLEIIPAIRVMTPAMSLPAQKVENARANGKDVADFDMYRYDDSTRYKISLGGDSFECGFALSDVRVQRKEVGGRWYSTETMPTKTVPELYRTVELITPNLPADLAKRFEENAKARTVRSNDRAPSEENDQAPGMQM